MIAAGGPSPDDLLWTFALELYARPGAEPCLLALQDADGQNICFLIWALWMAATGRGADAATLAAGAGLARSWDAAAVAPLRDLRRKLKTSRAGGARRREALREGVRRLELQAERMLLEMLQTASPEAGDSTQPAAEALTNAAAVFGGAATPDRLAALAAIAA